MKTAMRRYTLENDRLDYAVARRYQIPPADMHALEHLEITGGMTPGALAERLQLTSGSVTALVDRMEQARLVERAPHPTDRRSTVVRLTDRALGFAREAYEPFGEDMTGAARRLSAAERDVVVRFMEDAAGVAAGHAVKQARASADSLPPADGYGRSSARSTSR